MKKFIIEMNVLGGVDNNIVEKAFYHDSKIEETLQNVAWFFRTAMNMTGFSKEDTLYGLNMQITFNAEDEESCTCVFYGMDTHMSLEEVIWELSNALTFTGNQSDEIGELAFSDEEI